MSEYNYIITSIQCPDVIYFLSQKYHLKSNMLCTLCFITSIKCLFLGMMYSEIISKLIKMMQTCSLPKTFNMVNNFYSTINVTQHSYINLFSFHSNMCVVLYCIVIILTIIECIFEKIAVLTFDLLLFK